MSGIKKKRISKKTKRAWRKTDINDVEEFLEEQRQEERVGTFSEKPDDELFVVDATLTKDKKSLLSEKQKRKLNARSPTLRSHQAMENTSKVQDPIAKRNIVKQKKSGRNIEEEVRNPTRPRHFKANEDRGLYYKKLEARSAIKKGTIKTDKDIWQEEDFQAQVPCLKDEKGWISRDLALHVVGNIGRKVVKLHDSLRHKTSKANKFELPHPGMSYNPSLEAHQDLIARVVDKEEKIIKENKHLKRVTTDMFSKVTAEERDRRRIAEMSTELNDDNKDEENEDKDATHSDDDAPYKSVNPPVENKKKTKQARRKELKQKELQKRQEVKKALKKQIADLNRIKSINAEVRGEEEQLNQLKKHRKKVAEQKKFEPKVLGRNKFVEPDADVNMPEDIAGNLRNVKLESNLITDRFKNLQKRNILPVTVPVTRKKAKVKRFLRNSHKEAGVSYQMLREQRNAVKKAA